MHIIYDNGDEIYHYGTPRHSGRYPWGSGENPYQHGAGAVFLAQYADLKSQGLSDTEVAYAMGLSTDQFRRQRTLYRNEEKAAMQSQILRMREHGVSVSEIARKTGIPSKTVYNYLGESYKGKFEANNETAKHLKEFVDNKTYLDVGEGVANQLGISEGRLKGAIDVLKKEGYHTENVRVPLATMDGKATTVQVLVPEDVTVDDIWKNLDKISSPLGQYSNDDGRTWENIKDPVSISSDRIMVRYGDEGGELKDGVIELRRGVSDLSLQENNYAQVRIAVDGTHYLKGMAVYSDNLPTGVDICFNTNKPSGTPMLGDKHNTVLKPLKDDKDNPFGSTVRQRNYIGEDGKEHQSPINLVNNDEDWAKWNKTLSSQVLSKQTPALAKRQLSIVYDNKKQQFNDINKITIPAVKEKMLNNLAEDCDSSAVHLKAAALPRQATQVLLPLTTLKDNEVYAPNYRDGEQIALIRYPHAGRFEIPILTVNNKNKEGRQILGNDSKIAIGINANVAKHLSGADFDGDTVTAIPLASAKIKAEKALPAFDPQVAYPAYEGMTEVGKGDGFQKQKQMGMVSNLITDMTLAGAPVEKIARAVRHSMVIIDAEKHNLNWKLSERDNAIQALKDEYQPKDDPNKKGGGAHTLISKSKGVKRINDREDTRKIDEEGNKIYYEKKPFVKRTAKIDGKTERLYLDNQTGEYYYLKPTSNTSVSGKIVKERIFIPKGTVIKEQEKYHSIESTNMAEAKDAYELSSGTLMESVYADHANKLKQLARDSRLEASKIKTAPRDRNAEKIYKDEVDSLKSKLNTVVANKPKERQAQAIAYKIIDNKLYAKDPRGEYILDEDGGKIKVKDEDEENKLRQRVITEARSRVGAQSRNPKADNNISIYISDSEWEAIQAGAVPTSTLSKILDNADMDRVRELAIPTDKKGLSSSMIGRAKSLLKAGYTQAEVADMLGVSVTTINKAVQ